MSSLPAPERVADEQEKWAGSRTVEGLVNRSKTEKRDRPGAQAKA